MIRTGEEYIQSLRGRNLKVYLFGELVTIASMKKIVSSNCKKTNDTDKI